MKPLSAILLALITTVMCATAASADALKLRSRVNATSDVVVFSDFFHGTGEAGPTAFFRAPRSGRHGMVRVSRLAAAVERLGYQWLPPKGLYRIRVNRDAATVEVDEIAELIARELVAALPGTDAPEDLDITLPANLRTVRIADTSTAGLNVNRLDLTPRTRSFRATMSFGAGENMVERIIQGRYAIRRRVPVPAADIPRNHIIMFEDVAWVRLPEQAIGRVILLSQDMIGKAARRTLAEGQPVRAIDLESPRIVQRNQLVTVVYRVPGMTLTARGRALGSAAAGESVPILNLASNRTIVATATGPGQVSVTNGIQSLKIASSQ